MVAVVQARILNRRREEGGQPLLALQQGTGSQILTVMKEQIEGVGGQVPLPPGLQRLLELREAADPLLVEHGDLGIDEGRAGAELPRGTGDRGEAVRPDVAATRAHGDLTAGDANLAAIAVPLDLVQPFLALGRPVDETGELGLDEARRGWRQVAPSRRGSLRGALAARRDLLHAAAGDDTPVSLARDLSGPVRRGVGVLDQEPQILALVAPPAAHAHEHPLALEPLAVQAELEVALGIALVRVGQRLPAPGVPEHHRAAAILALRDRPLEVAIVEGVVLDMNGEPALAGVEARALRHGPALEHAVELEPQIIVQPACGVLLDQITLAGDTLARAAAGLGGDGEVTLAAIPGELVVDRLRRSVAWCGSSCHGALPILSPVASSLRPACSCGCP